MRQSPNEQQHQDITLEAYIHAARHACELMDSVRQDLIVLRSDVTEEMRHDADVSACGKLTAAEAVLTGVVRYHEEGRV